MKRLLALLICTLLLTTIFLGGSASAHSSTKTASLSPKVAYGCHGEGCDGLDPTAENCTSGQLTYKAVTLKDNNGVTLATGYGFYSYGCDSNWIQGTLTPAGRDLNITISTVSPDHSYASACFPGADIYYPPSGGGEAPYACYEGYNGETGWPAVSDMVDGTNVVYLVLMAKSKATGWSFISDEVPM